MPSQHSVSTTTPRRSLDTVSVWALLATMAVAIFIVIPSSLVPLATTKTFVLAAGTLVTLALYILARLTRGNVVFPSSWLVAALWLPALAYALSAVFSGASFTGALWGSVLEPDTLGFMLIAAVLGTLSVLVLRRPEHYRLFFRVAAYVFGALAIVQTLTVLVGQVSPGIISPSFAFFGSFSDLASLLGLGVIMVLIALRFLEVSLLARRGLIASGVCALFLLAIANSSLVWILVALVSLGLFVEAIMRHSPKTSDADLDEATVLSETPLEDSEGNHSLVLPLGTLVVSLFFLIGGTLGGALASAFQVNTLSVRPSWESTLSVAQKTYATSPVFGSGPGTFGAEWLKHRDASLNSTVFWNVDFTSGIGFLPTSFATTGIVGIIAWLVFLGLFKAFGLRTLLLRAPQDAFTRYVAIVSFVGTLYLFIIALFDLPSAVLLALAFVLAGLFISTTRYAAQGRQWGVLFSRSPRIGFVIVFSLTIVLLSSVVVAYTLAERAIATSQFVKAAGALSAGNLDAADRSAQNAISFASSAQAYRLQANIASARLDLILASTTMENSAAQKAYQTALSAGINAALTATTLDASDYQNWLALGNLYAGAVPLGVSGAYESAKTAYQKAQELSPTNPQIFYTLAKLDIAHKDTKSAEENLKAAIALKQDFTAAIFLLSQLEVQDGNVKDALTSALAAAYFAPNDPNILFQVGVLYAAQGDLPNAAAALKATVTANPQFANARYLLSAVYAKQGDLQNALLEMQAIANMSSENAAAVSSQLTALAEGKSPFPANLLSISPEPVK
ncbi:MAG: hypothetical protein WAV50_03565 [Minisyncoccia bacterium]